MLVESCRRSGILTTGNLVNFEKKTKGLASFFEFPLAFLFSSHIAAQCPHNTIIIILQKLPDGDAVPQDENETCVQLSGRQHRHQPCQSQLSHQTTGK